MDKIWERISSGGAVYSWMIEHGTRIAGILLLVLVLVFLLRWGLNRFIKIYLRKEGEGSEKEKRAMTLSRILNIVAGILIAMSGAMMIMDELGIDMKPVLASLGIGGLAIGFGAQSLVKDVISGFFILLEDQVRVGDVVQAAGHSGLVESVGLRVLVMRDLAGNRIIIPNSQIDTVVNMTYMYSRYVADIGVAYKEDVDKVMDVIREVGDSLIKDPEWNYKIKEPIEILGLDEFADSAVVIKCRITTFPSQQWSVGREFNRRLKRAFDDAGIEIPFPHHTVYFGDPDQASRLLEKIE